MKTLRDVLVRAILLLVGQTAYGMDYQFQSTYQGACYIDQKMYYQYEQPDGSIAFQCASEYPTHFALPYPDDLVYSADLQYPIASQNLKFSFFPPKANFFEDMQIAEMNLGVRKFFQDIIDDGEILSFSRDLLENARNNDAIQLVNKGYKSGPKLVEEKVKLPIDILKRACYLKEKALNLYLGRCSKELQQLIGKIFCSPLKSNNLIKLSHFAYNVLLFSHDQAEVICIVSLAFFTTIEQFNAIDRLRWAVKKGLWKLTEKTLAEGIHPNWVVERGGITALRTSEMNQTYNIRDLLLKIDGVDTTGHQDQNSYSENRMAETMRSLLRA